LVLSLELKLLIFGVFVAGTTIGGILWILQATSRWVPVIW